MLYVGCGNCRAVVPLFCGGRFMPHMPVYVDAGPMGIYCRLCGQLPPIFTCMQCGVTQLTYVSGAALPRQLMLPGAPSTVAPVVRVDPAASGSEIKNLLLSAGKSFLSEFAGHAGGQFGDHFGNWASSWFGDNSSLGQGNSDQWGGSGWQS
jgi:hypothetical protein